MFGFLIYIYDQIPVCVLLKECHTSECMSSCNGSECVLLMRESLSFSKSGCNGVFNSRSISSGNSKSTERYILCNLCLKKI